MHFRFPRLSSTARLSTVIGISTSFFIIEIVIGFRQQSLALVADAFHVLNDVIGFAVALLAVRKGGVDTAPQAYSFGYQRASLLGAFFNGVFLLALGVSILLQALERFVRIEAVQNPKLVLIVGGIGLGLNILSVLFVHEHHGHSHDPAPSHSHPEPHTSGTASTTDPTFSVPVPAIELSPIPQLPSGPLVEDHTDHAHSKHAELLKEKSKGKGKNVDDHDGGGHGHDHDHGHHDMGMLGVMIHLMGDAANNIGVMISSVIIMTLTSPDRYYADPAISLLIAFSILASSVPLVKRSGAILLESAPVDLKGVEEDICRIPGILDAHDLHVWSLTQSKRIASVHVATSNDSLTDFMESARAVRECLHHWSIHSVTMQPELVAPIPSTHPSSPYSPFSPLAPTARPRSVRGDKLGLSPDPSMPNSRSPTPIPQTPSNQQEQNLSPPFATPHRSRLFPLPWSFSSPPFSSSQTNRNHHSQREQISSSIASQKTSTTKVYRRPCLIKCPDSASCENLLCCSVPGTG